MIDKKGDRNARQSVKAGMASAELVEVPPYSLISDKVLIGNFKALKSPDIFTEEGVRSVLCLDAAHKGLKALLPPNVSHHLVSLSDDASCSKVEFLKAVDTLGRLKLDKAPVLVHCHAGMSRSAAVVIGDLIKNEGYSLDLALQSVASMRTINLNPIFREFLTKLDRIRSLQ